MLAVEIAERLRDVPRIAREFEVLAIAFNILGELDDFVCDFLDYALLLEVESRGKTVGREKPARCHILRERLFGRNQRAVELEPLFLFGRIFFIYINNTRIDIVFGRFQNEKHSVGERVALHSPLEVDVPVAHLARVGESVVTVAYPAKPEEIAEVVELVVGHVGDSPF